MSFNHFFIEVFMVSSVASPLRSVAFSAFRASGLSGLVWRPSTRSFSGSVLVCVFPSRVIAASFACRWASRLGRSVFVRKRGSFFGVSVPVAAVPDSRFSGWVVGGLWGLLAVLAAFEGEAWLK